MWEPLLAASAANTLPKSQALVHHSPPPLCFSSHPLPQSPSRPICLNHPPKSRPPLLLSALCNLQHVDLLGKLSDFPSTTLQRIVPGQYRPPIKQQRGQTRLPPRHRSVDTGCTMMVSWLSVISISKQPHLLSSTPRKSLQSEKHVCHTTMTYAVP